MPSVPLDHTRSAWQLTMWTALQICGSAACMLGIALVAEGSKRASRRGKHGRVALAVLSALYLCFAVPNFPECFVPQRTVLGTAACLLGIALVAEGSKGASRRGKHGRAALAAVCALYLLLAVRPVDPTLVRVRTNRSFEDRTNRSFEDRTNRSFVVRTNRSFVARTSRSFVAWTNRSFDPAEIGLAERKLDELNADMRQLRALNDGFFTCEKRRHRGAVFEHKPVHAEVIPSTTWILQSLGLSCIDMIHVKPMQSRALHWSAAPALAHTRTPCQAMALFSRRSCCGVSGSLTRYFTR